MNLNATGRWLPPRSDAAEFFVPPLQHDPVPARPGLTAPFREIWLFAATLNGYDVAGGFHVLATLAKSVTDRFRRAGELPDHLDMLRAVLWWEYRQYRHYGWDPSGVNERFVRALVAKVDDLADSDGVPSLSPSA